MTSKTINAAISNAVSLVAIHAPECIESFGFDNARASDASSTPSLPCY